MITFAQIAALMLLAIFYAAYFLKMYLQNKKSIRTNQMGVGRKQRTVLLIEGLLKAATLLIPVVEVVSILLNTRMLSGNWFLWVGLSLTAAGDVLFIWAMCTMRDSWRAGIPEQVQTELVTTGLYRISRNPAFLGFDLMYIGMFLAFANLVHLAFAIFAIVMLHLQILQEEKFLRSAFGKSYEDYRKKTGRYFLFI